MRCAEGLPCGAGAAAVAGGETAGAGGCVPQAEMANAAAKNADRKVHLQIFFRIVTIGEFLI